MLRDGLLRKALVGGRVQTLSIQSLKGGERFGYPLFHEDGTLLLLPYQELDELLLDALREAGIESVCLCEGRADIQTLRGRSSMREMLVSALPRGEGLASAVYDSAGRLLLAAGQELTPAHLAAFERRGILRVYERVGDYGHRLSHFTQAFTKSLAERVEKKVQEASRLLRVRHTEEPVAAEWESPSPSARTRAGLDEAFRFHAQALERTYGIFERMRVEGSVDLAAAHDLAVTLVDAIARDRDLAVSLGQLNIHNDYLIDHSLAVCVLSIATAARLGYGKGELLNLGIAAFLHDIGMTLIPREIVGKPGPLTPAERREIERHPAHGMRLVQRSLGASAHVPLSIYQTHERISGEGYPKHRRGDEIHDFAKVIAVADVYQAMTSPRAYKAPMTPYRAMEQILKMVSSRLLDPEVVRAFLQVQSLFPVGSWVRLNKGHVARVVSAVDDDYTRPRVSVVLDPEGKRLTSPLFIDLSQCEDVKIAEAIDASEVPLDFSAGLHGDSAVEPGSPEDAAAAEGPAGPERRKVPGNFMDWSASFAGSLADFRVLDIVQLLDLSQKSGLLRVSSPDGEGSIHLREGEMLSAEFGELRDEEAVFRMIGLSEGSFSFSQRHVEEARTIKSSNTSILMEGCRRIDEKK